MTWILILTFFLNGRITLHSTPGFVTAKQCEIAGERYLKEFESKVGYSNRGFFTCIAAGAERKAYRGTL